MNVTKLSSIVIKLTAGIALGSYALSSQANNDSGHNWVPNQVNNTYWQAPDWSNFSMPPQSHRQAPPPNYNQAPKNQAPVNQPNYGNANPNMQQRMPPQNPNMQQRMPPQNMNRGYPQYNQPRGNYPQGGYPPPQPRGPYYGPNQGPSAFYTPGYNRNRNNNNGWNNNKFWGRSGPSQWMNPNKRNMEQGWDDMINAPSRMGDDMPGGWSAPEVTMPNPVDMGDQMQDNLQDLPEQMKDGNIGNNVSN